MHWRTWLALAVGTLIAQPHTASRLRYVDLRIALLPQTHAITGEVRLVIDPQPGDLVLDLSDSMTVDSVSTGPFQRAPGTLHVSAGRGTVVIWYHGRPSARALAFTAHDRVTRVATYGLPNSAKEWWPTLDDPFQKADSADIRVTAPAELTVVSNGRLIDRSEGANDQATTHWAVRYPIYSDVISLAAADYVVRHARAGKVPLVFYVFPEDSAKADADFTVVPRVLAFYQRILGPYPFAREKYGIAEFARQSFREHQTIPSYGAFFISGKHEHDQIIAHEIAHQWFGNSVTVPSWRHIWLNESFSEYMAWRWVRADHGDSAFARLVAEAKGKQYAGSIAHADSGGFATMFGDLTFEKGPLVLAMLEQKIGTRAMDQALADYVRTHAYRLASQRDFQAICERYSGKSLDAFFTRWVARNDRP
jgi:aminopeptidase N